MRFVLFLTGLMFLVLTLSSCYINTVFHPSAPPITIYNKLPNSTTYSVGTDVQVDYSYKFSQDTDIVSNISFVPIRDFNYKIPVSTFVGLRHSTLRNKRGMSANAFYGANLMLAMKYDEITKTGDYLTLFGVEYGFALGYISENFNVMFPFRAGIGIMPSMDLYDYLGVSWQIGYAEEKIGLGIRIDLGFAQNEKRNWYDIRLGMIPGLAFYFNYSF